MMSKGGIGARENRFGSNGAEDLHGARRP